MPTAPTVRNDDPHPDGGNHKMNESHSIGEICLDFPPATTESGSSDNEDDDDEKMKIHKELVDDDENCWKCLPVGAEHIVKTLAAEEILLSLLNQFGRAHKVDFNAILSLVKEYPSTCHKVYEFHWYQEQTRQLTPLAVLACLQPSLEVVETVYKYNPAAISIPEPSTTAIPLDYACSYEAPVEVVQFLLKHSPLDAIATARHENLLPLHLACHFSAPPEVVTLLLNEYPDAIHNNASEGWYPLHAAAAGRAPLCVVKQIYEARPDSATARDSGDSTPLHIACTNQAPADVVDFLMQQAPETLRMPDIDTLTPLFRAVRTQTLEVVQNMVHWGLQQRPSGPNRADNLIVPVDPLGGTLLHHAAGHNQVPVVEFLCRQFPEHVLARTADPDQFLPIHVACLFASPLGVVQTLLRAAPESIFLTDSHGRTPLGLVEAAAIAVGDTTKYEPMRKFLLSEQRRIEVTEGYY